ncbi:NAD(P)H-binding protein [Amycolatopsis rhabdoformis]|uniref:NAD(P)H-binding protein n=1 Tax=Amycolatopsis rhabdoformis TaxID=1448059 RepID=A0ABZ1IGK0_9PSEU|nr:NAD(P)H-binding protein [Amycolatopsis rhabdoformis]WSE32674.1 NAD(P)H-binding protein [Amycolatopsis rhabdoformis]
MILVTGASGNVGSALIGLLGTDALAAYRDPDKTARAIAAGQPAVTLDLGKPETLPPGLAGVDTVFLLGAISPAQTGHELAMLDAARTLGARVVKLSVWRADEERSPVARPHRPVEEALRTSGLAWTILRPNFYQQNFLAQRSIRAAGEFGFPAITAPISFVDAADIARVAAVVLTTDGHDGRVYDLTGPAALTYPEAAEVFSSVLGRPIRYRGLPDEEARAALLGRGVPQFHADALVDVARAYRTGGAGTVTTTVADLTGRPASDLADFVRRHRAVFG